MGNKCNLAGQDVWIPLLGKVIKVYSLFGRNMQQEYIPEPLLSIVPYWKRQQQPPPPAFISLLFRFLRHGTQGAPPRTSLTCHILLGNAVACVKRQTTSKGKPPVMNPRRVFWRGRNDICGSQSLTCRCRLWCQTQFLRGYSQCLNLARFGRSALAMTFTLWLRESPFSLETVINFNQYHTAHPPIPNIPYPKVTPDMQLVSAQILAPLSLLPSRHQYTS